ncbi:unnamed protein product [Nippostrongylus brasiliensis]|uniref:Secreted protein n=1 Tax=Nippostrongylus brasiliensis TaxID=27835 RepID=A0A0N4YFM7_NIPBR|nr:unnamed protein product [Nippostrongylus brasiliensis]
MAMLCVCVVGVYGRTAMDDQHTCLLCYSTVVVTPSGCGAGVVRLALFQGTAYGTMARWSHLSLVVMCCKAHQ